MEMSYSKWLTWLNSLVRIWNTIENVGWSYLIMIKLNVFIGKSLLVKEDVQEKKNTCQNIFFIHKRHSEKGK